MKMMKKAAAMILSVCLTVPMFGTIVSAAQGQLMFSDPETKVGETVDVSLVVKTGGDAIGDADITMIHLLLNLSVVMVFRQMAQGI